MRLCACLWGGTFNPLIPVCRRFPNAWRRDSYIHLTGKGLAQGYIRFFEPDVYVEAQQGLADECGIDRDSDLGYRSRVVTLDNFVTQQDDRVPGFAFGLSIFDLYRELYDKEYRFEPRDERRIVLFGGRGTAAAFFEAVFGAFPEDERLSFFRQGYMEVFHPQIQEATAGNWVRALQSNASGPLNFTEYGIAQQSGGSWNPRVFVVDPRSPLDILDLWNLRLYCDNVWPFNVDWLSKGRNTLREFIEQRHRPLPGNPHDVMVQTTVELARSINPRVAEDISKTILNDLPIGSWALKEWYDKIWDVHVDDKVARVERIRINAKSRNLELDVESETAPTVTFASLSPEFAASFGEGAARWVNVLGLTDFEDTSALALTLPSAPLKLMTRQLSRGQAVIVSREGFVLPQRYKDHTQLFWLLTGPRTIVEWLRDTGIEASPSDSGRLTDQLLKAMNGFRGAHLISDEKTLKLLDKMTKSVHTNYKDGRVEEYSDRTAHVFEWLELINRRNKELLAPQLEVQSFVKAGALRLGLAIKCFNCEYENWYGVGLLRESLICERCLREYEFPQGTLNFGNTPWRYRVTGPFSVPNYADGAYATVLALRCLARGLAVGRHSITYSSNLNLTIDGKKMEVDFVCWYPRKHMFSLEDDPWFVVGESKSFAKESVQDSDVSKLKRIGKKIPGSVLVIAVLKDELSSKEKTRIGRLALWGREPMNDGRWRAPVVVLTGAELFATDSVEHQWNNDKGRRQELMGLGDVRLDNLLTLADLTQQIYLDLPAYWSWFEERRERPGER